MILRGYEKPVFLILFVIIVNLYWPNDLLVSDLVYRGFSDSPSMQPLIDANVYPGIMALNRKLDDNEKLEIGKLYVYEEEKDNDTILVGHRLVGIYETCNDTLYIFKGDNNNVVDPPISRNQVVEVVKRVEFE